MGIKNSVTQLGSPNLARITSVTCTQTHSNIDRGRGMTLPLKITHLETLLCVKIAHIGVLYSGAVSIRHCHPRDSGFVPQTD